jgi:hypothetical protein
MRITKRHLKRIIREEHEDWGMGEDEQSLTHPGEEDYTGHKGDESKTHPGEEDYEDDAAGRAHDAIAAIHDLASAAGVELDVAAGDVEPEDEMGLVALESRRRRKHRRATNLTERQLRKIVRQVKRRLHEDSIDDELDHIKKNVGDDLEHIRDLKDDIHDDHEEERRAEEERHRQDESFRRRALKRRLERSVRESLSRRPRRRLRRR